MFLRFTDDEIARLARFGEPRSYKSGDMLARRGEAGPGLMLILSGQVNVTQTGRRCEVAHIVTHERGNFMGSSLSFPGGRTWSMKRRSRTWKPSRSRRIGCGRCSSPKPTSASDSCVP